MPYISPEVIEQARQIDLLTYLRRFEPDIYNSMNFKGIYDSASEKDIFLVNTTRNMAKPKIISKVFGITMRNLNDKEISSLASFINFDLSKLFEFSSNKTRLVLSIFIILPLMNIGFVLQILQIKSSLCFNDFSKGKFADKLKECNIEYVHPIIEHSWGQRVVRFYDPDKHIIEVGENMKVVCKRFLDSGMTPEQVAERMNVPMKFINACMR